MTFVTNQILTAAELNAAFVAATQGVSVSDYTTSTGDGTTDNTDAFASALATGKSVFVPQPDVAWIVSNLTVPSGAKIYGHMPLLRVPPTTLNPMFKLGAGTDIQIVGLDMQGNKATQTSSSSGSSAITSTTGSARIRIIGNRIRDWTRHGVVLDGVTDAHIEGNFVDQTYHGAGVLCSSSAASNRVTVIGNHVSNTQDGNIQAFVEIHDWIVNGNVCENTNTGSGVSDSGTVADNITGYASENSDLIISNNVCRTSGNNGMHIGGDNLTITGNRVLNPLHHGIFCAKKPNTLPLGAVNVNVTGNLVSNTVRNDTAKSGIIIRNTIGGVVTGNTLNTVYAGVELHGFGDASVNGLQNVAVSGNSMINNTIAVWLKKRCFGCVVSNNTVRVATVGVALDNYNGGSDPTSSPCYYNLIAGNVFRLLTSHTINETAGDYNRIFANLSVDTSPGTVVFTGAHSLVIGAGSADDTPDRNAVLPSYTATGSQVAGLVADGPDTNITLDLEAKGSSRLRLKNSNGIQAVFGISSATGVAYPYGFGSSTAATYTADGSGTNLNVVLQPKGTGGHILADLAASLSLTANGQLGFQATSNTTLTLKYRGSDGTTRSVALTLA
jgi:hypothetical protein